MNGGNTSKSGTEIEKTKHDWSRSDPMADAEILARALDDPDAQPLSVDDMDPVRRTPQIKIIRRALGLSQQAFAERFCIPLGTVRDWEQGRCVPDQAALSYLRVIAHDPDAVRRALAPPPAAA